MATDRDRIPLGAPQPHKLTQAESVLADEPVVNEPVNQHPAPNALQPANNAPAHSAPTRTRRPKKPPRVAPAVAVIPKLGFPALRYKLNSLIGRPDRVPALSARELRLVQRHDGIDRLKDLCDKVPSLTVCFVNVKGAAATTTTTVHTASVVGDQTRSTLVVSDFNPASGTAAMRLGRDYDQTITLRKLLKELDNLDSFKKFINLVRPTPYSVRVISADSIVDQSQHLSGKNASKLLEAINTNCEYHFIDTANDITNPVILEVVGTSDVIVFTANVAVHDSLRQLAISMGTLRKHGYADKVDNSVVVISNLPKGKPLADYRYFLNQVNIRDVITREIPFNGQFLGVPHDPVIALDREVDLEKLHWSTYQAMLELGIAIFEQAPSLRASPANAF